MKIAIINENSQVTKNKIIYDALKPIADKKGYEVYNYGMEKDFRYIIGRNIKAERLRKDITQEKFAELINMSLSYVSKVEQGLTSPTALVLYKISRILEVKMEDFFKGITVEE